MFKRYSFTILPKCVSEQHPSFESRVCVCSVPCTASVVHMLGEVSQGTEKEWSYSSALIRLPVKRTVIVAKRKSRFVFRGVCFSHEYNSRVFISSNYGTNGYQYVTRNFQRENANQTFSNVFRFVTFLQDETTWCPMFYSQTVAKRF